MPQVESEDSQLSASDSLSVIRAQQVAAQRRLYVDPARILAVWGVAWLAGFGLYFLVAHGDAHGVPGWVAAAVLIGLSVLAAAVTFAEQFRRGRGVAGPSRSMAASYGWCWPLATAGMFAFDWGLSHQGLSSTAESLLWPGSFSLVVGVLFLAGGVVFSDRAQGGLGVWMLVVAAAGVFAGFPANFAVMAAAGGGGMLIAAGISWGRARRWARLS
jgi:hypothetical protein